MIDYGYRVELRPIEPDDLKKMNQWRNDPRIHDWCRQHTLISMAEHLKWYDDIQFNPKIKMFAVYHHFCTEEGDFNVIVGVCGLTDIDMINSRAEFSLYIGPEFQRLGFATGALQTLLRHGFENFGLNCIWGETFEGNPALRIFEKIGMKIEGKRRQFYKKKGKFIDCTLVSILKDEFKC